ncbi:MAG: ATP-dependent zinc metalloprotease FtsH [Mycoplasmataceae bacterium]|nr:ATP-dependent zinc metalloprotease FtsH [Mycoplasmataceae bacterium]
MLFSFLFSTNYISYTPFDFLKLSSEQINNIFDKKDEQVVLSWSMTSRGALLSFSGNKIDGTGNVVYRIWFDLTITISTLEEFIVDLNKIGASSTFILGEQVNTTSPLMSLIFSLLPWVLILGGTYWIMTKVMKSQGSIGNMNKGAMSSQISNIKFSDVAGYDEVKAELWEIVDFLKYPDKYNKAGARIPKGVLLSGPPGTGKTFFAKAVAGEASIPFFSLSGSDFVEMFVGVGAKRVRELFSQVKKVAPALIFIDELDAVGRQRGAGMGGGNDEREQTLNQMLVELDGFSANSGIVVLAATNRPDVLDPALKRPGRFDRSIEFRMPDIQEREAILKIYAKQGDKSFHSDVEWENIAGRTPGFSAAQLENVVNEAAILSVRLKKSEITLDIIDEAIDRVIAGPSKSNNLMSNEEKKLIAYHESGHALIGLELEDAEKVQKITIIPRGQAGGYVLMTPKKEKFIQTKSELEAKLISYMAGRAAEEIYFGKEQITTGAYSDIESSTLIARRMVTEFGMSELGPIQYEKPQGNVFLGRDYTNSSKNYSGQLAHEIDQEVRKLINSSYKKAMTIIKANKTLMKILAESLLIKETLTSEEAEFIYKNKKLPKQVKMMKDRTAKRKKSKVEDKALNKDKT